MKKYYLNAPKNPMVTDHSMMAEMVLEKALQVFQKDRLLKEIDLALETKNNVYQKNYKNISNSE